ncbi:MAG: AMP-binding protein [Thermomicrobiales bacterium]
MQIETVADVQRQIDAWQAEHTGANLSVAHLLCDRYADTPDRIALRYEDATGAQQTFTFARLRDQSARFATVLRAMGVGKGDRVATLLPKSPELMIATLAIWWLGAVHVPLFTAFGPQAISFRTENSGTHVVITDAANRTKLTGMDLRVVTVEGPDAATLRHDDDVPFWSSLRAAALLADVVTVTGDDLFILIYTSGTTGYPKGVEVPVRALTAFAIYMRFGLDVRDDDLFWNIADPGWAYGLYYALVGPLLLGMPTLFINAPFSVDGTLHILRNYGVTNFAAAPTVYRAMRATGLRDVRDGLRLRVLSSAGEPLNPDVIAWAEQTLGVPIHDQYGQTEHGMMIVNHNTPALRQPLRPGSMGVQMPGFRAVIVDDDGNERGPGEEGQIGLDIPQSPIYWFRGYYEAREWSDKRIVGGGRYYLSGDAASRDADNFFYFSGRADDIISSAGYRIGTFEVESALMQHPAVAEAAAVGKPDELRGEVVTAFVVLKAGHAPTDALAAELSQSVKTNLSAHAYPRAITFVDQLPKTPSGKVQRFLLRQQA